jgi:hypothetical protein
VIKYISTNFDIFFLMAGSLIFYHSPMRPVKVKCYNYEVNIQADSHIACRAHAAPMPFPCRSLAMPCVNSQEPCRAPALLRQWRVLRESPGGSRKYPNGESSGLTDCPFCTVLLPLFTVIGMDRCVKEWYASDNKLRGTPRGSRKKPNYLP